MQFNIKRFLIKNLELKDKEVKIFLLLFFHSFFIGWFIAFYFASANSEFIVQFGSEHLPYAYIIAGIAGYLVSSFYTFIQNKIKTKFLFSGALIFMFLITILGRVGLYFFDIKWLSGFVFIWAWPFISLTGIELGGLALRFLNLIQVKRLYGLFNMGGVVAAILSYFAIPLLKPVIGHLYDLLYIGAAGLIISIFILFRLYKQYGNVSNITKPAKKKSINLKGLLKEKYFIWIFASATLSMTMIYLTDFGFLSSIKVNISSDHVAQYLAIVYGALKVGEMIISYYSRRLLTIYGVKLGLTILPLSSSLLVIIAAIWGNAVGVGIVFLILMTTLKSIERILRRGLDDPAFNILYQPLADEQKIAVQSRVGIVMQFSIAIAGATLLLMTSLLSNKQGEIQLNYFPFFFLPILLLWVFVAIKLYRAYKDKIRQILAEISKDKRRGTDQYQYGSEILRKHLKDNSFFAVSFSATTLSEINPKTMEAYASNLIIANDNPLFIKVVTQNIDVSWRRRLSKNLNIIVKKGNLPADVLRRVNFSINNLDYTNLKDKISNNEVVELMNSGRISSRLDVVKYITKRIYKPNDELLIELFNDSSKMVVISMINISSSIKKPIVIEKVVSFLKKTEYKHIAANAILDIGSRALPYLEKLFDDTDEIEILLKIIEIYAKIGNEEAKKLLIKHLSYPNRDVQLSVIFALYYCKFQANESQIPLIRGKIEEIIDNILWVYAVIIDIEGHHNTLKLFLALDLEKEFFFDLIFLLLSFLYEPRIITLVQKNIIGKDTIFALEIMDNFFDGDIKKLITPIFDDITPSQKLKRLHKAFPQEKLNLNDRLRDIVMQDFERLDAWTISKAIELLGKLHKKNKKQRQNNSNFIDYSDIKVWRKERVLLTLEKIKKSEIPDEVFAAMYHTNELIYSTAAKIIFDENPVKCFDYLANMSTKKQILMNKLSNNDYLIDDKIKIIKRFPLFFNIPENLLPYIAKIALVQKVIVGNFVELYDQRNEYILFVSKGELKNNYPDDLIKFFSKNKIIVRGLNIDSFTTKLKATKDTLVVKFNRIDFFDIIISNKEIVRYILSDIDNQSWVFDSSTKIV